jgi:hypothetical protein
MRTFLILQIGDCPKEIHIFSFFKKITKNFNSVVVRKLILNNKIGIKMPLYFQEMTGVDPLNFPIFRFS